MDLSNVLVQLNPDTKKLEQYDMMTGELVAVEGGGLVAKNPPYSPEIGRFIFQRVVEGARIVDIAKELDLKSTAIIYAWRKKHPDFNEAMNEARELRADHYFDKALQIAEECEDGSEVQRRRMQIDTYKWAAEKSNPKSYGQQSKVTHEGGGTRIIVLNTGISREPINIECKEVVDGGPKEQDRGRRIEPDKADVSTGADRAGEGCQEDEGREEG